MRRRRGGANARVQRGRIAERRCGQRLHTHVKIVCRELGVRSRLERLARYLRSRC